VVLFKEEGYVENVIDGEADHDKEHCECGDMHVG
jgi:hypothetical protein